MKTRIQPRGSAIPQFPVTCCLVLLFATAAGGQQPSAALHPKAMDKRGSVRANMLHLEGERQVALATLRNRVPDVQVDLDPVIGTPRFVWSRSGFIQDHLPDGDIEGAEPNAAIRAFLEILSGGPGSSADG